MSGQERDALLAQFQSITGLEEAERATFFLEASNWNVDLAISSFFDDPDGAINDGAQPAPTGSQASTTGTGISSQDEKSTAAGIKQLLYLLNIKN